MRVADVTVVTPSIPVRSEMCVRAQNSIFQQTLPPKMGIRETDWDHTGSAASRNRALAKVTTEWVLWLDDDDLLMPNAVQLLVEAQQATGADVVSGPAWIPQVPGHVEPTAPLPAGWIHPDVVRAGPRLTVTALMRTDLVRQVGGFEFRRDPASGMDLDDWGLHYRLADVGATFWRIPETVFVWNIHDGNTSGRPDRW